MGMKQGKKVYKTTALQCYQYFSLRFLRSKWLPAEEEAIIY